MAEARVDQDLFEGLKAYPTGPGSCELPAFVLPTIDVARAGGIYSPVRVARLSYITGALAAAAYTASIRVGSLQAIKLLRARAYVRVDTTAVRRTLTTAVLKLNARYFGGDTGLPAELIARVDADLVAADPAIKSIDFDTLASVAAASTDLTWDGEIHLPQLDVVNDTTLAEGEAPLEFTYTRTANAGEIDKAVLILHYLVAPRGFRQ